MSKRVLSALVALVLLVTMIPTAVFAETEALSNVSTWDGTVDTDWYKEENTEFTITTAAELAGLAQLVNGGTSFSKKTVTLGADIDLANKEWTPIGKSDATFQGTFDGAGHTISNLTVTGNKSYVGLFGYTTNGAVKGFTLTNAKVSGYLGVGAVAGCPYTSKYSDITVNGLIEINGFAYVGGAFGRNVYASVTNVDVIGGADSYVNAVSTDSQYAYRTYVGGLAGFMGEGSKDNGIIVKDCDVKINVTGDVCDVGGLLGILHYGNTLTNCTYVGTVTQGSGETEVGGLVGVIMDNNKAGVAISGCTFTGKMVVNGREVNAKSFGAFYNGGATYSANKTYLIAATVNGVKTVSTNASAAAIIGYNYYDTLQAAIDAANAGDTITLLANVELAASLNVAADDNIIFDLNGKAITVGWSDESAGKHLYAFVNNGTLTLKDSVGTGSITARGAVDNYGTLTLESGSIYTCDTNGGYGVWNRSGSSFTMNGGLIENTYVGHYSDSSNPYNPACLYLAPNSTALITGGTIKSASVRTYAIISEGTLTITPAADKEVTVYAARGVAIDAGTAVINGGTFTTYDSRYVEGEYVASETYYPLYISGCESVTINGGTFNAPESSVQIGVKNDTSDLKVTGTITITGGVFNKPFNAQDAENNGIHQDTKLTISGGTFAGDPSEFIAHGKIATLVNGVYTVAEKGSIVIPDVTPSEDNKVEVEIVAPKPTAPADPGESADSNDITDFVGAVTESVKDVVGNGSNSVTEVTGTVTIPVNAGSVKLDVSTIQKLDEIKKSDEKITVTIEKNAEAGEGKHEFNITLTVGGNSVAEQNNENNVLKETPAVVTLPVPENTQTTDRIFVYYMDGANKVYLSGDAYERVGNNVVFTTDHFSTWGIEAVSESEPEFKWVNMTLDGILGVNFKVNMGSIEKSGYSNYRVDVFIGSDTEPQILTGTWDDEAGLYVFTAKLMAHRMGETLTVKLMNGEQLIQMKTFTVAQHVADAKAQEPDNATLATLLDSMVNYGNYAAYYVNPSEYENPNNATVNAVVQNDLAGYKHTVTKAAPTELEAVASLYLEEACDLRLKFNKSAFEGCTLKINGAAVDSSKFITDGNQTIYEISKIPAHKWDEAYTIVVEKNNQTIFEVQYKVLSYAHIHLGKAEEVRTGLNGLLKAMYLYHNAVENYIASNNS